MSNTNETNRMNERRRNIGLPSITQRASKPTRQMTTEDIREYLEEVKAIAEKLFPNQSDRDKYVSDIRSNVKKELLAEKVQLTDDDQILILDRITGKVKTTNIDNIKSKETNEPAKKSKDFFNNKSKDLNEDTSSSIIKIIELVKNNDKLTKKEKSAEALRAVRNNESLEQLTFALETLSREQQVTIKLLEQLRDKISSNRGNSGSSFGNGFDASSFLKRNAGTIVTGAILGGVAISNAIGSSGSDTDTVNATPGSNIEVTPPMAASPDGADVDAPGLRPESTQQPAITEQQIPEGATPVILNGRVVGYMPINGGPTVVFANNDRQALENVRAQVTRLNTQPTPEVTAQSIPQVTSEVIAQARPQTTSTTSEAAAAMAATPDGADVDAMGLRPESTPQPINSIEQQIPEDATPVRLDGRVVGYMPASGGPTVTFTDNDRRALENVRAQVTGSQLTTPPAATPTTTAGIRTRDFEARTSQTATPVVPDADRVSIESEQEIYNRLLQEQPRSFRDDVDVQNNLRDEARLTTQARRREAREATPQSIASQTQARPVITSAATATPTQQPSLTSLAGGIRPTGPNLEASGDNLRSTAVQIGLLPNINAPGRVTGQSEGNVVTEVTVGNQTVNLYDQGLLNDEQRQRVDDARRLRRLMSGQERLSPEAAKDEDNFLDTLRMGPSSRQNRVTAQTSSADATPAVVDIAAAPPAAISVRSNDQNAARVPVAEVPAVTTAGPTAVVQRRTNIASTENNNQEQILREAAVRAGLISNINAPGRITGKLEGNTAVEVTAGNRTINLYDQGLLDDEQRQRVDSARQLRTMMSGQQRTSPEITAEDDNLINSLTPNSRRSSQVSANPVTRSIATPTLAIAPTPDAEPQTTSSFRTLDASNISRRDNFEQSVDATTESPASGFEFANENIAQPRVTPITRSQPMTEQINTNVDEELLVNNTVNEREALSKEYESNPVLFSNRNLVLRAKKVTFASDDIEFKLPTQPMAIAAQPTLSVSGQLPTINASMAVPGQSRPMQQETPAAYPVSPAPTASSGSLTRPTSGRVTSPFGMRSMGDHKGIDYGVPIGTPVVAAQNGTIVEVRESSSYGNMIRIRGDDGTDTLYAHLSSFGVQQGQQVTTGQQIALSGNTGRSSGPHLHFEVIRNGTRIDPAPLLGESTASAIASQTPEPPASESDATPVIASTPSAPESGVAANDATPVSGGESSTPGPVSSSDTGITSPVSQPVDTATSGSIVNSASVDNVMAERAPAPQTSSVIDMSAESTNPSLRAPQYNNDPNDPGNVEPDDAAERYARLFDMAA